MRRRLQSVATALLFVLLPLTAFAQQSDGAAEPAAAPASGRLHTLVVAAGGDRPGDFPAARVDQLIQEMNGLMANASPDCAGVRFAWDGNIRYDSKLLSGGSDADLNASLLALAPNANVFWVYHIEDCGGVSAASGCSPTNNRKGMIVIDDGDPRGSVVWVHERGHVMLLGHIAQGVDESQATQAQIANIMYWMAEPVAHTLDTPGQCSHFRVLGNGVTAETPPVQPMAAPSVAAATLAQPDATAAGASEPFLTPVAQRFLSERWNTHAIPVEAAKTLGDADLTSMASLVLADRITPDWPRIVQTLGYRHDKSFKDVANFVLKHRDVEVPSGEGADPAKVLALSGQSRALIGAKLSTPLAIAMYAYWTGDLEAALKLSALSHPGAAAQVVGNGLADSLAKAARRGLAISSANANAPSEGDIGAMTQSVLKPAPSVAGKLFGDKVFSFRNAAASDAVAAAQRAALAPNVQLTNDETMAVNAVFNTVSKNGLDSFLLNGTAE